MRNIVVEKSFSFAEKAVNVYLKLKSNGHFRLADQFIGASTSIGANIEESQAAHSKADFISKMIIAHKEARESRYWIRLLDKPELAADLEDFKKMKPEIEELLLLLSSIIKSSRDNLKGGNS